MSKSRGNKETPTISKGQAIATSQRVGYLEPDECVLFCELAKKIKLRVDEQEAGDVRILRIKDTKFYSDK
jgi:hypothetical protein